MSDHDVIEGVFKVEEGSAKAGAYTAPKPTAWFPTIMAVLTALACAQQIEPGHGPIERYFFALYIAFVWPFWRMVQLAFRALRSKVSEEDADRLAKRFPSRDQRRSKA